MRLSKVFSTLGLLVDYIPSAYAAFGVTTSGDYFVVDCGSTNSLVFKVSKTSGDIKSLVYRGVELQYASQGTHIGSGLGTADVSASTSGSYVKITIATSTLTHYLIAKSGESNIYMATYITAQPSVGELRWIARLKADILPDADILAANTADGTAIEASDVYLVNGQTRSKFYSSERFIDDQVHCVYGSDAKVCMIMPTTAYEHSTGGPFMRDINYNNVGTAHNLYWYMNSGHVPTENRRIGLMGPYIMSFSRSGTPSPDSFDTSFFKDLSIKGYVEASGRGFVKGTTSGVGSTFQRVLHWYNDNAQYWAHVGSEYTSPAMKPGTYTMKYYRGEFPIATTTVTVQAGATATANIGNAEPARTIIWSIGDLDGRPTGFRNAENQLRMHPTDSRMSSWGPLTYAVGADISGFPMAQVKTVNDPTTITFTLTSAQATGAAKIRVATTLSFAGGRPSVTINGKTTSAAAPTKIDSRGLTRGAYRGYGEVYDIDVAAGTLISGANTLAISCISGSTGDDFLNPNFIYDSVQLWR